jgi:hypothetical protein
MDTPVLGTQWRSRLNAATERSPSDASLLFSPLLALIALVAVPPGTAHEPASPFEAELRRR